MSHEINGRTYTCTTQCIFDAIDKSIHHDAIVRIDGWTEAHRDELRRECEGCAEPGDP